MSHFKPKLFQKHNLFCSSKLKYVCEASSNILYRFQTWQLLLYQFHGPINTVFLENFFLLLVDLFDCIPRFSLPGSLFPSFSCCDFWLLRFIAGPSPENYPYLSWEILPSSPLMPPPFPGAAIGQWLTGTDIQVAVPTLWCSSCSRTPCR